MLWSDGCQTPAANFLRPRPSSETLCHFKLRYIFKDKSLAFKGLQGQSPESSERAITPKERLWCLKMFQCVSVLVLFLKELSNFRIACSLLSGCQSCSPYHFNLSVWIFSILLKFLFISGFPCAPLLSVVAGCLIPVQKWDEDSVSWVWVLTITGNKFWISGQHVS